MITNSFALVQLQDTYLSEQFQNPKSYKNIIET